MAGSHVDARVVQALLEQQPLRTTDRGKGHCGQTPDLVLATEDCAGAALPDGEDRAPLRTMGRADQGRGMRNDASDTAMPSEEGTGAALSSGGDSVPEPTKAPVGEARWAKTAGAGTDRWGASGRSTQGRGGKVTIRPATTGGGATAPAISTGVSATAPASASTPSLRPRAQPSGGWRDAAATFSSLHWLGEIGDTWAAPGHSGKSSACTLVRRRLQSPADVYGGKPSFAAGLLYTGSFSAAAARCKVARDLSSAAGLRDRGEESTTPPRAAGRSSTGRYATEAPVWTDTRAIAGRASVR
jgi:hypothetical protein